MWREQQDEIDKACAEGWVQENDADREACMTEASKIHSLLDTGISVHVSAPMPDGVHTAHREYYVSAPDIRKLAGAPPKAIFDVMGRYRVLSAAGFRCEYCGRSPRSGGSLYTARNPATGRDECLCKGCRGNRSDA